MELFILVSVLGYIVLSFKLYFFSNDILHKIASLFVITCLSEFIKRFIYTFGDAGSDIYFFVLFVPDILILIDIVIRKIITKAFLIFLTILIFYTFIAILNGQSIVSIGIMLRTVFMPISLMLLYKNNASDSIKIDKYMKYILFIMLLSIAYSCYQFFVDYSVWDYNWTKYSPAHMNIDAISNSGELNRAFGFFSEVANQGVAISITFLYVFVVLKKNVAKYLLLAIMLIGLIITASKAAIAALFFVLLASKLISKYKNNIIIILFLFGLLILNSRQMIYFVIDTLKSNLSGGMLSFFDPSTFLYRIYIIENFIDHMQMSPVDFIFGQGIGYTAGINLDNLYLFIIFKAGVIGLGIFFYFIFKIIKNIELADSHGLFAFNSIVFYLIFNFTSLAFTTRSSLFLLLYVLIVAMYHSKSIDKVARND